MKKMIKKLVAMALVLVSCLSVVGCSEIDVDPKSTCSHFYDAKVITVATAKTQGEIEYECKDCGHKYKMAIPALSEEEQGLTLKCSHEYACEVVENATTEKGGVLKYTCSKCADSFIQATEKIIEDETPIELCAHEYVMEVIVDATAEKEGMVEYSCLKCEHTYTASTPKVENGTVLYEHTLTFSYGANVEKIVFVTLSSSDIIVDRTAYNISGCDDMLYGYINTSDGSITGKIVSVSGLASGEFVYIDSSGNFVMSSIGNIVSILGATYDNWYAEEVTLVDTVVVL